jgi:hypothetical protein
MTKLMLNSLWGKFGQKPDLLKAEHLKAGKLHEFLNRELDGEIEMHGITNLSDRGGTIVRYRDKYNYDLKFKNIAIAAFVAAYGRIMLWEEMNKLGDRVMYHDTDSIIYCRLPDVYNFPIDVLLGEWSDENPDDKISEFVALGPKTYGYRTASGKTVAKCKGFTLNELNAKIITHNELKRLVQCFQRGESEEITSTYIHFGYSRGGNFTYTTERAKRLKVTANKNEVDIRTLITYPFGARKFAECPLNVE